MMSVILHHLNSAFLPGGFVGVDIFFVISGFLITAQINKEISGESFSILQFYKRRINRIAPALLTVTIATLAVGLALLSPADLVKLAKSAIYAFTGLSNIFFWREYGNYFAGNASEAPLLHTWSLGVEEQFYAVWPLLLLAFARLSKRRIAIALATLAVGALVASEIGLNIAASASYYLLPTRFFELMIGGLLASLIAYRRKTSILLSNLCWIAGTILIGCSLVLLEKSSTFPGINAVWPCLGAALVIWAGTNSESISPILSNRVMVSVGLISYSLYLWHWPIIAYLNYSNVDITPALGFVVVVSSFALAWISWQFVETPMRRTGASLSVLDAFVRRFVTPLVTLVLFGVLVVYTDGLSKRFDLRVADFEKAIDTKPNILRSGCHVPTALYRTPPNEKCRLGAEKAGLDGILVGDSFANHFSGMVDVMAKAEGKSFIDYTMDGCPPILGYDTGKGPAYSERCMKRNAAIYAQLASNQYAHVILAASWPTDSRVGEQLTTSVEAILKTGSKLTVILANEGIDRASSCPVRKLMHSAEKHCGQSRKGSPAYFSGIQSRFPSVHFLDPNRVICPENMCDPVLNETPLYRDNGHLNDVGARLIGTRLIEMGATIEGLPARQDLSGKPVSKVSAPD